LPPNVEVLRLSADIDQSIDRTGPAENLSARRDDLSVVAFRLRLGHVAPIEPAIAEKLAKTERNMKPRVQVAGSRLQQKNAVPTRRSKPIGQNAPSAAGPHDDEVERLRIRHAFSSVHEAPGDRFPRHVTIGLIIRRERDCQPAASLAPGRGRVPTGGRPARATERALCRRARL
jgi:hypothetical protein